MKVSGIIIQPFFLLVLLSLLGCVSQMMSPAPLYEDEIPASKTVAFENINVIDMETDGIKEKVTVLIKNGTIQKIGSSTSITIPKEAIKLDATGRYLIPGLFDMHVHLSHAALKQNLAYGITTVRNMWGTPKIKNFISEIEDNEIISPTIYSASPGIDGTPPVWPYSQVILDSEEAPALVKQLKSEGWNFLKVYNRLTPEVYHAIADAAKYENIRFLGHVPLAVPVTDALKKGQASIEHLTGYDQSLGGVRGHQAWIDINKDLIPNLVNSTVESETWNCPTLVVLNELSKRNLSESERKEAETNRFIFVKALFDADAQLLIGTDAGVQHIEAGSSLHEELQKYVTMGIPPIKTLQIATREAARFLHIEDQVGTITQGKQADLIILNANPLDNIENTLSIEGVMNNGRWLPQAMIK